MKKTIALVTAATILFGSVAATAETAIDTIRNAGTTQAFTQEAVAADDLTAILEAGMATASAINQQPWHFVAVTDAEVMAQLTAGSGMPAGAPAGAPAGGGPDGAPAAPEGAPAGDMPAAAPAAGSARASFGDSPAAIIIYMDEATKSPNPNFDCGLAAQSMYIAAASLGYGVKLVTSPTMSLNGEKHDEFCELLGIDPSLQAVAVLLLGRADTDATSSASTRSALEEKTTIIE